jgi:hypothetical protein
MKKLLLAMALQVFGMAAIQAQQIKGTVTDEQGNAISNATVSLLKAKDSSIIKLELSKDGLFGFDQVANDSFRISISYVGHQTFISSPYLYTGAPIALPTFKLLAVTTRLAGVTVTARKKVVEVKPDRLVLNVEGTINATGGDALELLRKSPGVSVDKDERLSVNGKSSVQVYVDNKPTPLNGLDLSNYLKSIPSAQIEAVEIIHNPGVMYEASGSAGIINIRLKKNRTMGLNGSITAGISASKHGRWEDGFSINYRNKRLNAYANFNSNHGILESSFELNRIIKDTAFYQRNNIQLKKENYVFKAGLDYTLGRKSNLGVLVIGNINAPEITNANTTPIVHYPTGIVDKVLAAENNTKQRNFNINSNLNYMYKDTSGRTLVVNADYGYYNNRQDQLQPNTFYDATGKNELYRRNYRIASPTRIDIYAIKADYEQNFVKGRLGFGAKAGYVKTDNDFRQYVQSSSDWQLDKDRSNFFGYRENVNAAYLNYSRDFKDIAFQAGIRAEQTNVEGTLRHLENTGNGYEEKTSTFKRDYVDFFPNASLTIAPKSKNQIVLSYSRRIDRPVYQDLNPFEYRINEYHYHKGSTELRPQYTQTVSLTHTFKYKLNTTLSYSHVKDVFGQLVDTAQGIKGYLVNSNIASQDITNLNVSYPFQFKNYSLFTNVNAYYSRYQADFGAGRDLSLDVWAVNIYSQNSYRFGKGWSAELSGFYSSPSIWQGTLKTASIWSADAGIQKQILKGNGTVKASVSDVFKTMKWSATSNFAGQDVAVAGRYDSRQIKLNFTYRFGNKNIKAARQVKTGVEEESNRTQSSSGLGH